jgi:hypothetical protein
MSFVAFLKAHLGCSLESGGGSFAVWILSTDLSVPQPSCTVHERKGGIVLLAFGDSFFV